jgi:hypothetical protein
MLKTDKFGKLIPVQINEINEICGKFFTPVKLIHSNVSDTN